MNDRFLTPTACLFPLPIIATMGVMRRGVRHGVLALDENQALDIIGRHNTRRNVVSGCKKEGCVNTVKIRAVVSKVGEVWRTHVHSGVHHRTENDRDVEMGA